MPFKFLQSIKKLKQDKVKNRSKSTTDLNAQFNLAPDTHFVITPNKGLKIKCKSKPVLFSISNNSSNGNLKETKKNKDNKDKSSANLAESKNTETPINSPITGKENTQRTHQINGDQRMFLSPNDIIEPTTGPKRSISCCTFVDGTNKERRLSDIAQLDQYIDYHQRRAAEDGSNAKRLVCAQILRESFVRLEQMRHNGLTRSQDKSDLSRSMSSLNHIPSSCQHFQKNKAIQNRRSSQWSFLQHQEPRLSLTNGETRRSWMSIDSSDKDEDGPIQFVCSSGNDSFVTENKREYGMVLDPVDISPVRDLLKKPKFMTRRKSTPVLTAQEIEIF